MTSKLTDDVVDELHTLFELAPPEHRPAVRQELLRFFGHLKSSVLGEETRKATACVEMYADRADRSETSYEFLERVYRPLIEKGIFFADDLHRSDKRLYATLAANQTQRGARLSDLIPVRSRDYQRSARRPLTESV